MATRIADLLGDSLRRHGVHEHVLAAQVVAETKKLLEGLFGSERASSMVPRSYLNGEVKISALHGAAAAELRLHEQAILRGLEEHFPRMPFQRLKVVVGR